MQFHPLVLVSQAHRSGGSLLSQLFDDHPQLCAHPFEIQIGHPNKWNWPDLDLAAAPGTWLEQLFERKLERFVASGYAKPGNNPYAATDPRRFDFDLERLRGTFLDQVGRIGDPTQRAIIDCYFAAFFAAWGDWKPSGRERWVTGFTPFTVMAANSVARLTRDYPDGRLITLVRDPRSWRVSSRSHDQNLHADLNRSIGIWHQSASVSLDLYRRHPERVLITTYERLVTDTETTMRRVAGFLGIEFLPTLTQPTFLGKALRPNSSFAVPAYGVSTHGLDRSDELSSEERGLIDRLAMPLYAEVDRLVAAERVPA